MIKNNYWSQKNSQLKNLYDNKTLIENMPKRVKFLLVGDSGVGKTTFLSNMCINCNPSDPNILTQRLQLVGEQERLVTPEEKEAWQTHRDYIPTSRFFNWGLIVLSYFNHNEISFNFPQQKEIQDNDILIALWDTMGQKMYTEINKAQYQGTHGIFYLLDGTLPINKDRVLRNINIFTGITSNFKNNGYKIPPIIFLVNKQDKPNCRGEIMYKTILSSFWDEIREYDFLPISALTDIYSLKKATAELFRKCLYSGMFIKYRE